ncbi:hypothetical protein EVAR_8987_1 [Eumeta japonica]|uniref:Uncharacterized protein n=1 Tax=Eumeta variegata TaxID=151549 RepID=A0A4C1WQS6_EUMVA|nr:hypothetical protein EVAR_8987_1 [Eumeta japonica]
MFKSFNDRKRIQIYRFPRRAIVGHLHPTGYVWSVSLASLSGHPMEDRPLATPSSRLPLENLTFPSVTTSASDVVCLLSFQFTDYVNIVGRSGSSTSFLLSDFKAQRNLERNRSFHRTLSDSELVHETNNK